nr:DnaJ homolog subfamily C GRV2 isoform X1 [Tanacetum cinerariifolium]
MLINESVDNAYNYQGRCNYSRVDTIQPSSTYTSENFLSTGAQQADHSIGVVSPDAAAPAENLLIESVVSNTEDLDDNATGAENSDLTIPAPAQELRGALQAEVHKLDVEKERTEDIVPGVASSETSGQDSLLQISWNYTEFTVRYPSLLCSLIQCIHSNMRYSYVYIEPLQTNLDLDEGYCKVVIVSSAFLKRSLLVPEEHLQAFI